jgi:hypothetical protein
MATEPSKIFTLSVKAGIRRDGTKFEGDQFSDGMWCRFQRGKAKKVGGYRQMFATPTGIPRGVITNPFNGVNYVFVGNDKGIEVFNTGNDQGVGVGPFPVEFNSTFCVTATSSTPSAKIEVVGDVVSSFPNTSTFWTYGTDGLRTTYTVSGTATYSSGTNRTTVPINTIVGMLSAPFEVYIPQTFPSSDEYLWQFDITYDSSGNGNSKLLAHPGKNLNNIDSGVLTNLYAGDFLPDPVVNKYVLTQVYDSTGATPTYAPIEASGGVVVLHPFVFVYSNFGRLQNNNVEFTPGAITNQTFSDWNGPLSNDTNMTAGKIIKGFPVRGGTSSPSGLFWATDSLLRVSFTSTDPYYWRYDTVAGGISVMSSNSIVEMDGLYFWMGTDRFYVYNGSAKVLPNDRNVNYLFNNLNFSQRQKVWGIKVPRYNEIWWFYPRGTATECTDAIIYNVKDELWYDAGQAMGARRSCGYITEVFPRPIWCSWEPSIHYGATYDLLYGPEDVEAGTNEFQVIVAGDITTNPPGSYMSFGLDTGEEDEDSANNVEMYQIESIVFTNDSSGGQTLVTFTTSIVHHDLVTGSPMTQVTGGYVIWEHEFGKDKVTDTGVEAIHSYVETSDISWIGGSPAEDNPITPNRRMHITRVEPDFNQVGDMTLTVVGRPFAQSNSETNGPFVFTENDGKIDLRVEHRLINLRFDSNVVNGDYEMGRVMITAEFGDERP